jgi:hypothetical protein
MEFDDYVFCDANVSVCEIHLRRRRSRRRRRKRRRSGGRAYAEQTIFFNVLQGLEATRKYIQQFDVEDDILVTRNKLENKLYTLKYQEKRTNNNIQKLFCFDFENDCYFMNFILNS